MTIKKAKKTVKRPAKKKLAAEKPAAKKTPKLKLIGKVSHYFDKIQVAAIKLLVPLKKGDTIRIQGGAVDLTQKVISMQKERQDIKKAKKGDEIGVKVNKEVHEGYRVYKAQR